MAIVVVLLDSNLMNGIWIDPSLASIVLWL